MAERCPNRWLHGVMTCPVCGNNDRGDNVNAVRDELNDWRNFGFAQCGPPITCDQDMRDGIEEQFRTLRSRVSKLEAVVAAQSRVIVLAGDVRNRYQWEPEDWSRFDDALEKLEREQGGVCSRCGCEYVTDRLCPGSNYTLMCRDPGALPPQPQPSERVDDAADGEEG